MIMTALPITGAGHEASESTLVRRLRSGEAAAFDDVVRGYCGRMLAVALRMLRREEDAQDAVQEAFLSAFRALEGFDGRSALGTWLHRITVNACLMKLRTQRRRGGPERSIDEFLPTFAEDGHQTRETPAWSPEAEAGIEREEMRCVVRAAIDELPEGYRVVLLLRDIEGLSTEETAAAMEMSPNAVKTRLHRARQALRALLEPHFSTPEAL